MKAQLVYEEAQLSVKVAENEKKKVETELEESRLLIDQKAKDASGDTATDQGKQDLSLLENQVKEKQQDYEKKEKQRLEALDALKEARNKLEQAKSKVE